VDELAGEETFLFADFRLDRHGGLFSRNSDGTFGRVAIGSRALDLLILLVRRRGDLVSKGEIMTTVAGDRTGAAFRRSLVEAIALSHRLRGARSIVLSLPFGWPMPHLNRSAR
jgi:DNA-binding winged helix-turn-helix (wHTH) protein